MNTQHRIEISVLNDCYGVLLTSHQTEMIRLYYDLDVSLSEIAEQYSVSRQAVRDAIMRGERALEEYENSLHIVAKTRRVVEGLESLKADTSDSVHEKIDRLIDIMEGD